MRILNEAGFSILPGSPEGGPSSFGWSHIGGKEDLGLIEIIPTPAPPLMMWKPGRVLVDVVMNGKSYRRGEFRCGFVAPPPLTDEERRAIMSRPGASQAVVFRIKCTVCEVESYFYSQLDPLAARPNSFPQNALAVTEAPDSWKCKCGQTSTELTYMKLGLHDFFRYHRPISSENSFVHFTSLYEAGRIQDLIAEYEQLIENASDEEPVQKFLEEHSLFWGFLSPVKILHKPAILTKKRADFGVLTAQKILYLIELEKPSTKLTNKDGAISGEIQRGANQIRDWQLVVSNHRLSLLSELGVKETEVQEIRYLLIGGLARRASVEGLTKLRRSPLAPNSDFYCFDELASFLHTIAGELGHL